MRRRASGIRGEIDGIVRRIVRKYDPDRVILFGSHARGDARANSDVDLLLVMPVDGSKRAKRLEIQMLLNQRSLPVDVVITRPEDFAWRKNLIGTVEYPAAHEGKVLYAKR